MPLPPLLVNQRYSQENTNRVNTARGQTPSGCVRTNRGLIDCRNSRDIHTEGTTTAINYK